jgi:hypothetical protein
VGPGFTEKTLNWKKTNTFAAALKRVCDSRISRLTAKPLFVGSIPTRASKKIALEFLQTAVHVVRLIFQSAVHTLEPNGKTETKKPGRRSAWAQGRKE